MNGSNIMNNGSGTLEARPYPQFKIRLISLQAHFRYLNILRFLREFQCLILNLRNVCLKSKVIFARESENPVLHDC